MMVCVRKVSSAVCPVMPSADDTTIAIQAILGRIPGRTTIRMGHPRRTVACPSEPRRGPVWRCTGGAPLDDGHDDTLPVTGAGIRTTGPGSRRGASA